MAHYMIQVSYTSEAWAKLVKKPVDRGKSVRPVIERLGGSLVNSWFSFGEYDVVLIVEMPDNVSVGAFSIAAAAGGAVSAIKTTPLMEIAEGLGAMKRAAKCGYRPPGK